MSNYFILILLFTFSFPVFSQYKALQSTQNFRGDLNVNMGSRTFEKSAPERDPETGLITRNVYDQSMSLFNISILADPSPLEVGAILAADAKVALHWKENIYWTGFVYAGTHEFNAISEITTPLLAVQNSVKDENSMLIAGGIGAGVTSNFFADVLGQENLYETMTAQVGLASFSENIFKETYIGPGFRGELGLHWRLTPHNHLGLKFLWSNYSVLRDERSAGESESDRHLSLSWLSIGVDWGIYF